MKDFLKKNFAIVLAFALPIALIIVIALSVYIPSLFISTNYNFIYSSCAESSNHRPYYYYCSDYLQERYSVADGKLSINTINPARDWDKDGVPDINENYIARIFLHDTEKNESREITLEEAQTLSLNGLLTSPDGVTFSNRYSNNGDDFFFIFGGGSSSYGYYLTKGKGRSKINLINNDDRNYYQDNFRFIGWVLPGRN